MRDKKKATAILLGILIMSTTGVNADIFVAPSGKDTNNGSKNAPFATLQRAKSELRKIPAGRKKRVIVKKGIYYLSKPLIFSRRDSGKKSSPVLFQAEKGAEVIISGGIKIPLNKVKKVTDAAIIARFVPEAKDKIYTVNLAPFKIKKYGKFGPRGFARPYIPAPNELIINGKAQTVAQWPNLGQKAIRLGKIIDKGSIPRNGDKSGRGGIFGWNNDRPLRWTKADNFYLSGLFMHGYADDTVKITKLDTEKKTFTTKTPHMYGYGNRRPWNTWVAKNLLEEIDQPGEYFVDIKTQKIYFYPSVSMKEIKTISLSTLERPMISLLGASYIEFQGITFQDSRGIGVYIEGGTSCMIKDCVFRNLGIVAVNIGKGSKPPKHMTHEEKMKPLSGEIGLLYTHIYADPTYNRLGGTNHGVVNCKIYDIGAGGIILGGGDRKRLKPAGNFVRNCEIHDFNRLDRTYKTAVNIDGVGNKIQHCKIYNAPGTAILLHGNNHITEYNEIFNVMLDGDDQGSYYLGRDPSEFGNILRYNYFHDIGISSTTHSTWTVYYDDGACGNIAYGNIFRRAGKGGVFLIGGGSYNKVTNNIFIDCRLAFHIDNRVQGWGKSMLKKGGIFEKRLKAVKYNGRIYSKAYPELAKYFKDSPAVPKNLIEKNLFYKCARVLDRTFKTTTWRDNWNAKNTNPGFANIAKGDYSLKEDAEVFTKIKGFEKVPFKQMGLKK